MKPKTAALALHSDPNSNAFQIQTQSSSSSSSSSLLAAEGGGGGEEENRLILAGTETGAVRLICATTGKVWKEFQIGMRNF
jgi:hypothetical protein